MESGFFKAQPRNTSGHRMIEKAGFIWLNNPTETSLILTASLIGGKYYDGCDLIPADKNDAEFIEYLEKDILKVQEEIDKLLILKNRLIQAKGN